MELISINDKFFPSELNWNVHSKVIWASQKLDLIQRFKELKWQTRDSETKEGFSLPPHVAFELQSFCDKAEIVNVLEVAYDMKTPLNQVLAIKSEFADTIATIYLHANTKQVVCLATTHKPKNEQPGKKS